MLSKEEKSYIKQEKMFDERNMFINEKNICDLSSLMILKFDNFLKTDLLKNTDLKIHIKIVDRASINAYAGFVDDDYKVSQILITKKQADSSSLIFIRLTLFLLSQKIIYLL